jgi:predicted lactoylglutathione lyase
LGKVSPFFIVDELAPSVSFYEQLGFEVRHRSPEEDPFFAIVGRDDTQILLKEITQDINPQPNSTRHPWARWDAFISVENPDALAAEFAEANIRFASELQDTEDGLRGFELRDNDGYILFFGRPR